MLYENHKLDLSRKVCHICYSRLDKDYNRELEWCRNARCILHDIRFSIPYKTQEKKVASAKVITRGRSK